MSAHPHPSSPTLARGDVETLCILRAVGTAGCPGSALARRLGLSPALSDAVVQGMEPLLLAGLLARTDDRFTVTEAGRALLTARLAALGLDEPAPARARAKRG